MNDSIFGLSEFGNFNFGVGVEIKKLKEILGSINITNNYNPPIDLKTKADIIDISEGKGVTDIQSQLVGTIDIRSVYI